MCALCFHRLLPNGLINRPNYPASQVLQVIVIKLTSVTLLPLHLLCSQGDSSMQQYSQACLGLGASHKTNMIFIQCRWHVSLGALKQLCTSLTLAFARIHAVLILSGCCVDWPARACHPMNKRTTSSIQ